MRVPNVRVVNRAYRLSTVAHTLVGQLRAGVQAGPLATAVFSTESLREI